MTSNPGTITSPMLTYLGPRLQAVYSAIKAEDMQTFNAAWPLAQTALDYQKVDTSDLSLPRNNSEVGPFAKSILTRAKPQFNNALRGVGLHPVHLGESFSENKAIAQRHIAIRREMIEIGALQTYAGAGLVDHDVIQKFVEAIEKDTHYHVYPQSLMKDIEIVNAYLNDPINITFRFDKMWEIFGRYMGDQDTWSPFFDDLAEYSDYLLQKDFEGQVEAHRATIIDALRPGIESRLMYEVLRDPDRYTFEEIRQIYQWGFISPKIYQAFRGHRQIKGRRCTSRGVDPEAFSERTVPSRKTVEWFQSLARMDPEERAVTIRAELEAFNNMDEEELRLHTEMIAERLWGPMPDPGESKGSG